MNKTDAVIQSLYARATDDKWDGFRFDALSSVCELLGAHGSAWATHNPHRVLGEYTVTPRNLAASPQGLMALEFGENDRVLSLPEEAGSHSGIVVRHRHMESSLISTVAFWFSKNRTDLSDIEISRVVCHMVEAGALSLRQHISRDDRLAIMGRASRGATALVDASGTIYAASGHFRELVAKEFDVHELTKLPFTVPDDALVDDGLFSQGDLRFRSSRSGSLFMLHARQPQPLDSLSPREQQIARALGKGKTFKSVARQCGIAVSTVANHASRIYRKLGIYRREDLVELVRAPHSNGHVAEASNPD